jgi:hypothetical protein
MPDSADQLRAQIRTLQAQRRSLESKLLQPQSMLPASLIERFLRAGGSPRTVPAYYLSRSEHGRSKLTYVKKEDLAAVRQHCAAYRAFQAEHDRVAAGHCGLATAMEAVAAGPVPIKHFRPFLSISLDIRSSLCHF